jgi:hypothetical protein
MLEVRLDPNYKLYVIQPMKQFSLLCTMQLQLMVNGMFEKIDLQLGLNEFRVYHNALLECSSQAKF